MSEDEVTKLIDQRVNEVLESKLQAQRDQITEKYDYLINKLVTAIDVEFTQLNQKIKSLSQGHNRHSHHHHQHHHSSPNHTNPSLNNNNANNNGWSVNQMTSAVSDVHLNSNSFGIRSSSGMSSFSPDYLSMKAKEAERKSQRGYVGNMSNGNNFSPSSTINAKS